ncbi:YjdF family protein [Blautia sp. RD014234]|nr:YjdF family protein [Blautia parvula]
MVFGWITLTVHKNISRRNDYGQDLDNGEGVFSGPFWIGLCERTDRRGCSVCKITFGPEPKEYEVQEFISQYWYRLSFSPAVAETEMRCK